MKLKKCRNCQGKKLSKLFSLGKLSYTGKFPKNINTNIKKTELTLVMCNKCSLVQLIIITILNIYMGLIMDIGLE